MIFLLLSVPFLILKISGDKDESLDLFLLIISVFCLLLYIWVSKMFVTIDNDGIAYNFFFRKTFIPWKDIISTKLAFEFHGKSGDFIWNFTSNDKRQINFSTGYFSKSTIRAIAEAVVEKCSGFVIGGKITEISKGKFPWYIF